LMESDFTGPVNIGSDEMVTINQLASLVMDVAGRNLSLHRISGPLGVRGRNSDNRLIKQKLNWSPSRPLREGLEKTYSWIQRQITPTPSVEQLSSREATAYSLSTATAVGEFAGIENRSLSPEIGALERNQP